MEIERIVTANNQLPKKLIKNKTPEKLRRWMERILKRPIKKVKTETIIAETA